MSKKAEIIKKDVILITIHESVSFSKDEKFDFNKEREISLNIENFKECRLFKKTHSIKKEDWTYYCKDDDYYFTNRYCLIIDLNKKQEAIDGFFNCVRDNYQSMIDVYENNIKRIKNKIFKINKIENETNI